MVLCAVKISQVSDGLSLYLDGSVQYALLLLAAKIRSISSRSQLGRKHMD